MTSTVVRSFGLGLVQHNFCGRAEKWKIDSQNDFVIVAMARVDECNHFGLAGAVASCSTQKEYVQPAVIPRMRQRIGKRGYLCGPVRKKWTIRCYNIDFRRKLFRCEFVELLEFLQRLAIKIIHNYSEFHSSQYDL